MPTSSLSSPDDDEDFADEHTVSLSLLPTLPDSTLGSTSVITPSSLGFSSVSTASFFTAVGDFAKRFVVRTRVDID